MNEDIGKPVLYPISPAEQETTLIKHADDQYMVEILLHAYDVQHSLDLDILNWSEPASATVEETVAWLQERQTSDITITPYDYRRYARSLAANLLFLVNDDLSLRADHRIINERKWSSIHALEYRRCVAICSAAWQPSN